MSANGNDTAEQADKADERRAQRRTNDSLQGGEDNPAYGEDARDFGAARQRDQRAFDPGHNDAKDRDVTRDPTVPTGARSGSKD